MTSTWKDAWCEANGITLRERLDEATAECRQLRSEILWHENSSAEAFKHLEQKQRNIVTALGGDPDDKIGPLTIAENVRFALNEAYEDLKVLRENNAKLRAERQ